MERDVIESVTEWTTVPVGAGYAGLHRLADDGFSGTVTAGGTWAFLLNGRVIGVFDGAIAAFEDADLTAREAPDRSLPLLYTMRQTEGETRAKYYTNDTPLAEADRTLSDGKFTGYVELSENVLSGDYYVVYYGGSSMSAAFLGNSRRLVTGEEAFDRANDEVGIYEIRETDVEIVEIPEPDGDAPVANSRDEPPARSDPDPETEREPISESDREPESNPDPDGAEDDALASRTDDADLAPAEATPRDASDGTPGVDAGATDLDAEGDSDGQEAASTEEPDEEVADGNVNDSALIPEINSETASAAPTRTEAEESPDPSSGVAGDEADETPGGARAEDSAEEDDGGPVTDTDGSPAEREGESTPEGGERDGPIPPDQPPREDRNGGNESETKGKAGKDVFTAEERWRKARAIPALDPESSSDEGEAVRHRRRPDHERADAAGSTAPTEDDEGAAPSASETAETESSGVARAALVRRLRQATEARERLAAERDELRSERSESRAEIERLEARVAELEAEVERLEARLAETGADTGPAPTDGRTMDPERALVGTNLFVRYRRKGDPTLEDAHAGKADREAVNENLRLEYHTEFDAEGLTVGDRPFDEYLRRTVEYGFVEWLVSDLPYEIRETGNRGSLDALYGSLPAIDRVELHGSVPVTGWDDEEGEETTEERTFDVVCWDGRGNPLVVANLNVERDAATEEMVATLAEDARAVGERADSLGAAFFVTASFYEPAALDVVEGETGSGLLSRSKRTSFVKLSRKRGFHLCLVEGRNGDFHVNVPDL